MNNQTSQVLTNAKIQSILSITGNEKCLECGKPNVEWVNFPFSIFLCQGCCNAQKEFQIRPILKCLTTDEFTPHEVKKMNLGGNSRFLNLLLEYQISLNMPSIEHKYRTVIANYYSEFLEAQVNKFEGNEGANEIFNKLIEERPNYQDGVKIIEIKHKSQPQPQKEEQSALGGFFSFIGNKISEVGEKTGITNMVKKAGESINETLESTGIKNSLDKGLTYAKLAGSYVANKGKEVMENPTVKAGVEKVKEGAMFVGEKAKEGAVYCYDKAKEKISELNQGNNNQAH